MRVIEELGIEGLKVSHERLNRYFEMRKTRGLSRVPTSLSALQGILF